VLREHLSNGSSFTPSNSRHPLHFFATFPTPCVVVRPPARPPLSLSLSLSHSLYVCSKLCPPVAQKNVFRRPVRVRFQLLNSSKHYIRRQRWQKRSLDQQQQQILKSRTVLAKNSVRISLNPPTARISGGSRLYLVVSFKPFSSQLLLLAYFLYRNPSLPDSPFP
jgi:hypothetical protein